MSLRLKCLVVTILLSTSLGCVNTLCAQVWQWSVSVDSVISSETNGHPQAYLWIPENCRHVRAVVFSQHNMIEEGMLENETFRKTMAELDFAEVWVTPGINMPFDFTKDAGEDFTYMMDRLAVVSGYVELKYAPVVPLGHSAYATFPWNFAAWSPERTLALISIHGDAPQTNLTGYGGLNVDWGNRNVDGVPALFIMGEFEWWEDRIAPAFDYIEKHPGSVISLFCDAGHGHFDYSEEMIAYVCLFIRKAAESRLPVRSLAGKPVILLTQKPENGWLMDRWRKDSLPEVQAGPYGSYKGDRKFASWIFDQEMAEATEVFYSSARNKRQQYIGFFQDGFVLRPDKSHANFSLRFSPLPDGISFRLRAFFADSSRVKATEDFATSPLEISRICGPVKKIDDSTFQLSFNRLGFNNKKRSSDIWLLASNRGDTIYKSVVQQAVLHFPLRNREGDRQEINFRTIHNTKRSVKEIRLKASSSAGVPVHFYVKEGPAEINGNVLKISRIPPRARFPMKVTVVAWQYGRSLAPRLQSAEAVERSFFVF